MPYTLKLKHNFDSAHKLLNHGGACSNIHGHRWEVEVVITVDTLKDDMVADFEEIKAVINKLDHSYLNELVDFNPTAENLAKYLKEQIDQQTGLRSEITIWESPTASVTYK